MMFPTGMSPTEGWESQLVENVQERHFCVTVIFVPSLESTFLSHSDRQTGQNRKSPRSDDSATRNRFCWWGGAFLGDSLWIIQWIFSGLFLLKHLNFLLQCNDFIMFRTPPLPSPFRGCDRWFAWLTRISNHQSRQNQYHYHRHLQASLRGQGRMKGHHLAPFHLHCLTTRHFGLGWKSWKILWEECIGFPDFFGRWTFDNL